MNFKPHKVYFESEKSDCDPAVAATTRRRVGRSKALENSVFDIVRLPLDLLLINVSNERILLDLTSKTNCASESLSLEFKNCLVVRYPGQG